MVNISGFFFIQETSWTFIMTGLIALSFIIGATLSIRFNYPKRLKGDLSAFSAGIFFSTVSFILVDESIKIGSFTTMAIGFASGALVFSFAHKFLKKQLPELSESIKNIEKENIPRPSYQITKKQLITIKIKKIAVLFKGDSYKKRNFFNKRKSGSANTLLIGKLMDSIPKALFIGVIVALDLRGLVPAVISLFLGNLTATMEGARRMKEDGKSPKSIIKKWLLIAVIVALAGPIGYYLARPLSNEYLSILIGFAAGDLIAFIVEDLIPEAYKKVEWHTGLSASFGFLVGLTIFHFL